MVPDDKHISEALMEAIRRYPEAERGLIFFYAASGLGFKEPTPEAHEWVGRRVQELGLKIKSR